MLTRVTRNQAPQAHARHPASVASGRPAPRPSAVSATYRRVSVEPQLQVKTQHTSRAFATAGSARARVAKQKHQVRPLNIEINQDELNHAALEPQMVIHQQKWKEKVRSEDPEVRRMEQEEKKKLVPSASPRVSDSVVDPSKVSDEDMAEVLHYLARGTDQAPSLEDDRWLIKGPADELPVNEVLEVGRHCTIVKGGRVFSFSALVMVGTGEGAAGLGRARGLTPAKAVQIATEKALKNIISIERYRGASITKDLALKFKRTKVVIKACRMGWGIKASFQMRTLLSAFGLTDVSVATLGRKTNKVAMYRAIFKGLQAGITLPDKLARDLGIKFFDIQKTFYYKHE